MLYSIQKNLFHVGGLTVSRRKAINVDLTEFRISNCKTKQCLDQENLRLTYKWFVICKINIFVFPKPGIIPQLLHPKS